ncbi:MAG: hypothetical protein IPH75_16155 [bacterium]|nr:hypothetical protein [bacterium]
MADFILSESEAKKEMEPLRNLFSITIHRAFSDYRKLIGIGDELLNGCSGTFQAIYMSDRIRYYLSDAVDGDGSVKFEPKKRQSSILIRNMMRARVKKANSYGRGSFGKTQAARDFLGQVQQEINFEGTERRITNVIVCYQLNAMRTELMYIRCICPFEKDILWSFDITGEELNRQQPMLTQLSQTKQVSIRLKSRKAQANEVTK